MSGGLDAGFVVNRGGDFRVQVDISVLPGRTVALLGPNGAGKSTVVAALAGLLPVEEGRIELSGRVLDDPSNGVFVPPAERRIGVVFQDYLLFPHLSVRDNVAFGLRSQGEDMRQARQRADHWTERMGLSGLEGRRPAQLSGGEAQRVALARALATEPELLLLDEPLAALDVTTRISLRRQLADHLDEFVGPRLFITHDPSEAFLLADQVHVLEDGRVTQSGSPEEIRLRPRTAYAADLADSNLFLGRAEGSHVRLEGHELVVAADGAGDVLVTIRPSAVAVHRDRPRGSARNVWETTIARIEPLGERTRLLTGSPLEMTAEVTPDAVSELGLAVGVSIWVAIKATEIGVEAYAPAGES